MAVVMLWLLLGWTITTDCIRNLKNKTRTTAQIAVCSTATM